MTKRALVINPWVTDFKLYDEWMHPLGLYFLISLLTHNKWEVDYINCLERDHTLKTKRHNTGDFSSHEVEKPQLYSAIPRRYKQYGINKDLFLNKLYSIPKPDMIFVGTGMTYWFSGVINTVSVIRSVFPDLPVILGGISATLMPEIARKELPDCSIFPGSLFMHTKRFASLNPLLENLSDAQWPGSLIDAFDLVQPHFHGPILSTLGCPFKCTFCGSFLLHDRFTIRPLATVISEITACMARNHSTDFAFYDDALLFQAENNFFPLTDAIASLRTPLRIHCPNGLHARFITESVAQRMVECGFKTIRLGYESGSLQYQNETGVKISRQELAGKISLLHSRGIALSDIGVYVMAGLPGQKPADVLEDIRSISSLRVKVKPVFLSPVPGTPVFATYASLFSELTTNFLTHNDTYFITTLPGWDYESLLRIKETAKEANRLL